MNVTGKTFDFQVVSPENVIYQGQATMVVLPATSGSLGVLADHAPTVVTLGRGIIDVYQDGQISKRVFVGGGFANITGTGCLTMADEAIFVEELLEEDVDSFIRETEAAIEKSQIEEEKEALQETASIARSKIDIIKMLQPEKKVL